MKKGTVSFKDVTDDNDGNDNATFGINMLLSYDGNTIFIGSWKKTWENIKYFNEIMIIFGRKFQ